MNCVRSTIFPSSFRVPSVEESTKNGSPTRTVLRGKHRSEKTSKGETFEEGAAKYISFRPLDNERFVRGSAKSFGKEYAKERIWERIERKRERKAVIPKKDYSVRRLIDTSDEKFKISPGLQRWAAIENLKIAAQSYNEVGSLSELEHKIAVKTEAGKSAKQSVVELEHRIKDLAEIIKYAQQYKANRSYHIGYKKAKNPDAYFRKYERQIINTLVKATPSFSSDTFLVPFPIKILYESRYFYDGR